MTYAKSAVWVVFIAVLAVVGDRREMLDALPGAPQQRASSDVHRVGADGPNQGLEGAEAPSQLRPASVRSQPGPVLPRT